MLRLTVLLLLLANLLVWGYTQGHLALVGLAPEQQREPERLSQQLRPEKLQLLPPMPDPAPAQATPIEPPAEPAPVAAPENPAPQASATASRKTACWQATGYNASQTILLNAALQKLPGLDKRWTLTEAVSPGRWIVYLGKFPTAEALQRSRDSLKQLGVEYRDVNSPSLSPGLALGTFSTEVGAQQALQNVSKEGVRGARVVQVRPDARSITLNLPAITDAERDQIQQLPVLADKQLQRCS